MLSANPLKGEVGFPANPDVAGFEAGGIIVLDFNALCALEEELGEKIDQIGEAALRSPMMMRTVFRIGLEAKHGAVDERDAGNLIQAIGADVASELTLRAFQLSFPEAAKDGSADPRKPAATKTRGTGPAALKSGPRSGSRPKRSGRKPPASTPPS